MDIGLHVAMKMKSPFVIAVAAICLSLAGVSPARSDITWTEQTDSGIAAWNTIASSSSGAKLAAAVDGGYIYTSTDSGLTWTQRAKDSPRNWRSLASSSDGVNLAAAASGGHIYTSTDSGQTWNQATTGYTRSWRSIASSSDGTKLAAVVHDGYIYTSDDSGASWKQKANQDYWVAIASSDDGVKLAAVVSPGYIYTSTDSGGTWHQKASDLARYWTAIASSADGTRLIATVDSGYIYLSNDSGGTWTPVTSYPTRRWTAAASSSDGTKLAATVDSDYIYVSTDSGTTWTQSTTGYTQRWTSIASSSEGTKLAAVVSGGYIWTGESSTSVDLVSFGAYPTVSGVFLRWKTGTESENAGFHVWRATAKAGAYSRVTDSLIPAEGDPVTGATYVYRDSDVNLGERYCYKLEDIDDTGAGTYHGPVSATVGTIRPISPKNGAVSVTGTTPCFRWKGVPYDRFRLQFSRRADFRSGVVSIPGTGAWLRKTSFTPGKDKWKGVAGLTGSGRAVYWRVTGKDSAGGMYTSNAFRLFVRP